MTDRKRTAIQATAEASPEILPGPEDIHAALIARLSRIEKSNARVKTHRSLQPTPEAAKGRLHRLRRKQRQLIQESKRASLTQLGAIPAASDPLPS